MRTRTREQQEQLDIAALVVAVQKNHPDWSAAEVEKAVKKVWSKSFDVQP